MQIIGNLYPIKSKEFMGSKNTHLTPQKIVHHLLQMEALTLPFKDLEGRVIQLLRTDQNTLLGTGLIKQGLSPLSPQIGSNGLNAHVVCKFYSRQVGKNLSILPFFDTTLSLLMVDPIKRFSLLCRKMMTEMSN